MNQAVAVRERAVRKGPIEEELFRSRDIARIRRMKERFITATRYVSSERALLVTEAYRETEGEPIQLRRAMALKKILERMNTPIYEDELVVGSQNEM